MLLSIVSALALLPAILLSPWVADEPPGTRADIRPLLLMVATPETTPEGMDTTGLAKRVVDGAALRLQSRGVPVQTTKMGVIQIAVKPFGDVGGVRMKSLSRKFAASGKPVTLLLDFGMGANQWASGTETRFGGEGDAAWRLASLVQHHMVRGLWDVMAYDSYDRGVLENSDPSNRPGAVAGNDPWVVACPLFTTNAKERSLLESPETLDLLSSALANAIHDYLDSASPTPSRSASLGWHRFEPWQPVSPRTIYGVDGSPRLALTFDGGASSVPTPAILKALREAGVHATMFMTADFVESNPELVVQMAKDGHEFGNHSSTHPDMTKLSVREIVAELDRLEASVFALTGRSTRPWFRPPYGACDERVASVAAEQGYYTIMWTADSADWREDVTPSTVLNRLLNYSSPGAIMIEHLGSPQSAQVLPELLRLLKARGVTFGTLSEVVGTP